MKMKNDLKTLFLLFFFWLVLVEKNTQNNNKMQSVYKEKITSYKDEKNSMKYLSIFAN